MTSVHGIRVAWVALGSNLGNREKNLQKGLIYLEELGRIHVSPLILESSDESAQGPDYLNTVVKLETRWQDPRRLLEELLRMEARLGRERSPSVKLPRLLDLDLICFQGWRGFWIWPTPLDLQSLGPHLSLNLPHPRARQRPFVMEPLRVLWRSQKGAVPG